MISRRSSSLAARKAATRHAPLPFRELDVGSQLRLALFSHGRADGFRLLAMHVVLGEMISNVVQDGGHLRGNVLKRRCPENECLGRVDVRHDPLDVDGVRQPLPQPVALLVLGGALRRLEMDACAGRRSGRDVARRPRAGRRSRRAPRSASGRVLARTPSSPQPAARCAGAAGPDSSAGRFAPAASGLARLGLGRWPGLLATHRSSGRGKRAWSVAPPPPAPRSSEGQFRGWKKFCRAVPTEARTYMQDRFLDPVSYMGQHGTLFAGLAPFDRYEVTGSFGCGKAAVNACEPKSATVGAGVGEKRHGRCCRGPRLASTPRAATSLAAPGVPLPSQVSRVQLDRKAVRCRTSGPPRMAPSWSGVRLSRPVRGRTRRFNRGSRSSMHVPMSAGRRPTNESRRPDTWSGLRLRWWPGAGSNRRPSTFQADARTN